MNSDVHVYPHDDLREHQLVRGCWCRPAVEEGHVLIRGVVIHNALDGREVYERGERKPS